MTSPTDVTSPWETAGQLAADELANHNVLVVVGFDPVAAAQVALGIGRVHARRRRVAIVDAVGELPPVQALLPRDARHGLQDTFLYGVSLNKIAYPIDPAQNLYLMPSGSGPVDHAALLGSDRWRKLASGFREVDALLLILAPSGAPGFDNLLASTDGAVIVGSRGAPVTDRVVVHVRLPDGDPEIAPLSVVTAAPTMDTDGSNLRELAHVRQEELVETTPFEISASSLHVGATSAENMSFEYQLRRRTIVFVLGAFVVAAIIAALYWWAQRPRSAAIVSPSSGVGSGPSRAAPGAPGPFVSSGASGTSRAGGEPGTSGRRDGSGSSGPARSSGTVAPIVVANLADSSIASPFSVELVVLNTMTSAIAQLEKEEARGIPASSFAPIVLSVNDETWYRVIAGAYGDRAQAEKLLWRLRAQRAIPPNTGRVIRTPFALVVERDIAQQHAAALVRAWRVKGLPVYALLGDDGMARLYAGAFESPEQAAPLLGIFRTSGETPQVVYRVGRVF